MSSGATFSPFEIVVVPFPFTERLVGKRRPALVLSSAQFNRDHDQLLLAMITSGRTPWQSDIPIENWREAGLSGRCALRFKLFTLPKSIVIGRAGILTRSDRLAVTAVFTSLVVGAD